MLKKSLAIVLFALCLQKLPCKAQSIALGDTQRVIDLNLKAWQVRTNDLLLSKRCAEEAIAVATPLNYSRGLSYSYNILGNYYKVSGIYDSSLSYYQRSLKIRQILCDTLNIIRSFRNIMSVENATNNRKKAISTGLEAIRMLSPGNGKPEVLKERAMLENQLGLVYFNTDNTEQALRWMLHAKEMSAKQGDENGLASACLNLGTVYESQQLYRKALGEYTTALPVFSNTDDQENLARTYNGLGNVYYQTGNYQLALSAYDQSLSIKKQYGFTNKLSGTFLNLGIVYEALGKNDTAVSYYNQALRLSKEAEDEQTEYETRWALGTLLYSKKKYSDALMHLLIAWRLLSGNPTSVESSILLKDISKTYKALNRVDSALFYSNQYTLVSDSLNEAMRRSVEMGSTIRENEKDMQLIGERSKVQNRTIIGLSAGIILFTVIFFLYYLIMRSKRNMHELRELVKDKELKALDAMLEGQQEERKRLATELHDTIGSMLSATKYSFKAMEKSMEKMIEENRGQYHKINSMLDETMDSVRRISHDMAAGIFTEKGMEGALRDLCQTFEQPGNLHIQLNVYGFEQRIEYNAEINLYRIIQELLTNIIKHANAREVTIQLIRSSETINLTVEDDGRGFNQAEEKKKKGMGLSNIDLRVKKLSGHWNIDSGKGKGTTVIIDIPIIKTL